MRVMVVDLFLENEEFSAPGVVDCQNPRELKVAILRNHHLLVRAEYHILLVSRIRPNLQRE